MTTSQTTRIKIWKNETTGYALTTVTDPYGVIHVTDTEGFHATTLDPAAAEHTAWERSLRFGALPWQSPAPQMVSPHAPAHRVRPSGLARGTSMTQMTGPQARALRAALAGNGTVSRGGTGDDLSAASLRAMERRGWLELDDRIRPTFGRVTPHGRKALERFDARTP